MAGMGRLDSDSRVRIGSVKAAVSLYGERIVGDKAEKKKTEMVFTENTPSKAKELHLAKRDIGKFSDTRKSAETTKARAESELFNARKTVEDLSLRIKETDSKVKEQKREIQRMSKQDRREEEWALSVSEVDGHQYMEVMRELEQVKQDLSKLKLDMASVLEAKAQAEKETASSVSRARSCSSSVEALRKEIEETEEEQVLVELARMEAIREYEEIEAERKAEVVTFSTTVEKTRKRIKDLVEEINQAKDLETKLEVTASDVNVLQNELKLLKAMDKNSAKEVGERGEEESVAYTLLQSAMAELKAANEELASIREDGFQFMASMDIIREELKHVSTETARMRNIEVKTDSTVQNLNSKILRAKSKLESVSAAEEKAKSIVFNLSATLQQLQTETEAAKKERDLISEETASIKVEIQRTESDIDTTEEKLIAAMKELDAVKRSEAIALENLRTLTEKTMRDRASLALHSSTITISKYEYEYLSRRAEGAEEIADKKVAAAQAWIEALKAGEKEILMKTELTRRDIRETKAVEEKEIFARERNLTAKRAVEGELRQLRQSEKQMDMEVAFPRKSMRDGNIPAAGRRPKIRRPNSPAARQITRSGSINLKKRRKVMPNLVKLFRNKGTEEQL